MLFATTVGAARAADFEALVDKGERVLKECAGASNLSSCYGRSGIRTEYLAALRDAGAVKSALAGPRGRNIVYQVHSFIGADDAMPLYDGYLAQHPDDSWALMNLAMGQASTQRWAEALVSLEKARHFSSDVAHSDVFMDTKLNACFMLRRYADIRAMYQESPRYFEEKVSPLYYVAYAAWQAGEPRSALELVDRVVRAPGADVNLRVRSFLLVGRINEQLGDKCPALRAYADAKSAAVNPLAIRWASNAVERLSHQRACG